VGVTTAFNPTTTAIVERFTSLGTLDPDFNGDGDNDGKIFITFDTGTITFGEALAIDSQGRIVVGGSVRTIATSDEKVFLARLTANGALDPSFGSGGKVQTDIILPFGAKRFGFALDGLDRIVLTYTHGDFGVETDFAVARFNTNGTLDPSFGAGGSDGDDKVTVDFFGGKTPPLQ
jgi:uncharacterized delta-60 repeat protein